MTSKKRILPNLDEIIYAISEEPLGMGAEAKVYKIHTDPDYTVRVSNNAPDLETLSERIYAEGFTEQKDIFNGRNYAQAVAYMGVDTYNTTNALVTINLYSPGFSMEIYKPKGKGKGDEPSSDVALMKTLALTKAILEMPDEAIDKIYDDLHFLSSREYSIDTGNGLFTNMGNILLSGKDKEFRIIDIQPFIRERVGILRTHTKGFNTPFYLTHGLIPGLYKYGKEHSKYPPLIDYRTEIIDRIIKGAQRNNLNDVGNYSRGSVKIEDMARPWEVLLNQLHIPEKYQEGFVRDILSVKQEHRYRLVKHDVPMIRVSGRDINS